MKSFTPRLRMFAGPNGSGKSTLKTMLSAELLGVYLNPDEIEASIRSTASMSVRSFGVEVGCDTDSEIAEFLRQSQFLQSQGLSAFVNELNFKDGEIDFSHVEINSYFASVLADYLRQKLLAQHTSFTLETVMSSRDKVGLLKQAQDLGYRTYLYFIATEDSDINISRVHNRVQQGGHSVPEAKIVERYVRSLELLIEAIRSTNRAYIFDNSGHLRARTFVAEITNGTTIEMKTDRSPDWFSNAVLKKI